MNLVFLHVGDDPRARIMVSSAKATNPHMKVIQCSDFSTNEVDGIDEIVRFSGNISNLMTFRPEAFAKLESKEESIYVDTDMVFIKKQKRTLYSTKHPCRFADALLTGIYH